MGAYMGPMERISIISTGEKAPKPLPIMGGPPLSNPKATEQEIVRSAGKTILYLRDGKPVEVIDNIWVYCGLDADAAISLCSNRRYFTPEALTFEMDPSKVDQSIVLAVKLPSGCTVYPRMGLLHASVRLPAGLVFKVLSATEDKRGHHVIVAHCEGFDPEGETHLANWNPYPVPNNCFPYHGPKA